MASHTQWKNIRLGDVAKVISGFAFKSKDFQQEGIPIIKIKNIRVGAVDLSEIDHVDSSFLSLDTKYHVKGGDILISLTGSHLTQPNSVVGRVALHSSSLGHCLLNQRAGKIIITKPDICDKLFLFYSIYTEEKRREIALMALGAASQANVSPSQVESVEMKLPPLFIQRKTAAILSAYDRLIENNTRRIEILEEMARSIYREWFVKFRFPGHEQVQMVHSELGLIPEGWEVKKLEKVADINASTIKPSNAPEEINYIDISSVSTGKIDKIEPISLSNASSRARRIVKQGDIIWSTVRPNRKSYSLILNPIPNLIVSTGFAVVTPKNAPYTYLYHALTTDNFVGYLTNNATGSAYPAVNTGDFKNAEVLIPCIELMNKFHNIVADIFSEKDNFLRKNINLRQTRDLLLPRLISGEIDVENLDINTGQIAA